MKIKIKFVKEDFWIGFYWDKNKKWLYVCFIPCVPIIFKVKDEKSPEYGMVSDKLMLIKHLIGLNEYYKLYSRWIEEAWKDKETPNLVILDQKASEFIINWEPPKVKPTSLGTFPETKKLQNEKV